MHKFVAIPDFSDLSGLIESCCNISTLDLSFQEGKITYTPDTQAKLYAGYTGEFESYTPDTQVKLYAGYTGQLLDARWQRTLKNKAQKTIRRIHR